MRIIPLILVIMYYNTRALLLNENKEISDCIKKKSHFTDILPIKQFLLLELFTLPIVADTDPLNILSQFAWHAFKNFRTNIKETRCPFGENTEGEEEYYRIRSSLSYQSLNDRIWKITDQCPLSKCDQYAMIAQIEIVLCDSIDECEWNNTLQQEFVKWVDIFNEHY